jgi:hypothetical protein
MSSSARVVAGPLGKSSATEFWLWPMETART